MIISGIKLELINFKISIKIILKIFSNSAQKLLSIASSADFCLCTWKIDKTTSLNEGCDGSKIGVVF